MNYTTTQATTIGDIGNSNGVLTIATGNGSAPNGTNLFGPYVPVGSYQHSSQDISITLSANCLNANGSPVASSLTYTTTQAATIQDIANSNGALTIVNT